MEGKIVKGIASFYYVHVPDLGVFECKAKGIFRNQNIKPLVGDNVLILPKEESFKEGLITDILPRKNELIRPAVANIDQAMVIFSITKPKPNFNLLDRFLITMERQGTKAILCFNKKDLVSEEEVDYIKDVYKNTRYEQIFISALKEDDLEAVFEVLKGKTTAVAGPSGVGKSSLINRIQPEANMEIGEISEKISRGKHTTRHSELINIKDNTYIMDTPGFSSLVIGEFDVIELRNYFTEFHKYQEGCKFQSCAHINEPDCKVKEALNEGMISDIRYKNYLNIYNEIEKTKKY